MCLAAAAGIAWLALPLAFSSPAGAAVCERTDVPTVLAEGKSAPGRIWCVAPSLGARRLADPAPDVSAISCTSPTLCAVASDRTRFAQVVRLDRERHKVVPMHFVHLDDTRVTSNGNDSGSQPPFGIEAGTAVDGRILLMASHGVTRGGESVPERHSVFAFDLVESALNRWPAQRSPEDGERERAEGVVLVQPQESGKKNSLVGLMVDVLEPEGGPLQESWGRCLQDNGFNVEGLATLAGRIVVGLRGPTIDGGAQVITADLAAFLAGRVESPRRHGLPMDGLSGIRALEPLGGGLLVLSGRSQPDAAEDGGKCAVRQGPLTQPVLYYWGGPERPSELREVARFAEKSLKPEAMHLLNYDSEAGEIEVIVFFDGEHDGAPVSYRIPFRE